MYTHNINIRVRYAETDQMGFVYYGNYAVYFEVARVETLRSLGVSYKALETKGIMLPVINYQISYHAPALYDDSLRVETVIKELPKSRIKFDYTVWRDEVKICTAETTLVFMNGESKKPMRCPAEVQQALNPHFNC